MNNQQEISYTLHIAGLTTKELVDVTIYNASDHTLDGMKRMELSHKLLLDRISEMEKEIETLRDDLRNSI